MKTDSENVQKYQPYLSILQNLQKNKVFLTLLVFDENLTNPGKMKSNKTDLGNLNFEKVNFDREMLKKTTFTC